MTIKAPSMAHRGTKSEQNRQAMHSSGSNEHYTPGYIVDIAREVLGGKIDLDPASCAMANKYIHATNIYTIKNNGLNQSWYGRIFLNPPGGKDGASSVQCAWWRKLVKEYKNGNVTSAIFLGFSIEILQTSQAQNISVAHFPLCIPRKRIDFLQPDGNRLKEGTGSTHSSVIAFLPKIESTVPGETEIRDQSTTLFREKFKRMGVILNV